MLLSLGLGEPRLWPAILDRVGPADCTSLLIRRVLETAKAHLRDGVLAGLAEVAGVADEGERDYLAGLRSLYPGDSVLPLWCGRVREAAARRGLQQLGRTIWRGATQRRESAVEVATAAARELARLTAPGATDLVMSPDQWLDEFDREAERRREAGPHGIFQPTGIPRLDSDVGVEVGDMVIVAAETGVGKTAFGLSVARTAAAADVPVLYANTEMSAWQLAVRVLAAEAGVSVGALRRGLLTREDYAALAPAKERMRSENRLFLTRPLVGVDAGELGILVRAHQSVHGLGLLVVDYVGRLDTSADDEREYRALERIARGMKGLAQDLHCTVYLLVQRTAEGHLAGSKRMRNEADLVLELSALTGQEAARHPNATHKIAVTKARNAAGDYAVPVRFDRDRMTFGEVM